MLLRASLAAALSTIASTMALSLAACGHGPGGSAPAASITSSPPVASAAFSRAAFAMPPSDAGSADLPIPRVADSAALDELLAAAPKAAPRAATGADGGTAVGSDSGVAEEPSAEPSAAPAPRSAKVHIGKVVEEGVMSGPAIERAARAQLYWELTQKCRDLDGGYLPPDAVHLTFKLDADGYLVAPTILAEAHDERFAKAARCMQRTLSTMTFRAPVSARGKTQFVMADVPSVD